MALHWDASPIALTLAWRDIHWPVHWYGLLFAGAFVYGIVFFQYLYRLEGRRQDEVYDLALYFMLGTLFGARLGHALFYDPVFYFTHPLEILKVWQGGMASHGALIGILTGIYLYSRSVKGATFLWVADRIGMAVPISGVLIRTGNFVNSEILGRPTDMPWGVVFSRVDPLARHPVQLYESFCYLLIFLVLFRDYRRSRNHQQDGWLLGRALILIFCARFLLENFKEGQAVFESGWPLTVGQLLSLPAILAGFSLLYRSARRAGASFRHADFEERRQS